MISYMGGIVLSPVKIACAQRGHGVAGSDNKKEVGILIPNLFFPAVRTGLEPALARQAPWHCLIPRQNRLRYFDRPQRGLGVAGSTATKKEVEPRATQPLYFLRCGRDSNPRLRGKRPKGGMGSRVPTTKKRSGF